MFEPLIYQHHGSVFVSSQVREVEYRYFIYVCSSTFRSVILGLLYGYKIILLGVTVVMALKTKKVNVQGLNDYHEVVLATYVATFVLAINFVVNYTMDDEINSFAIVTSLSIFIGTTAIILLVFVPKVICSIVCYFHTYILALFPGPHCFQLHECKRRIAGRGPGNEATYTHSMHAMMCTYIICECHSCVYFIHGHHFTLILLCSACR